MDELDGVGDGKFGKDLNSLLYSYPPIAVGEAGYSNWDAHYAKEIYPIVGIFCVGMRSSFWLS